MAPNLIFDKIDGEYGEILNEVFVNQFRTGYLSVQGCILPEYFREFGDDIRNSNVRNNDVWICSFPKCGNVMLF